MELRLLLFRSYLRPVYCIKFVDTRAHEQANNLIALFNQKVCGNAAVNAATHSDNDFCFHRIKNNRLATEGTVNTELQ